MCVCFSGFYGINCGAKDFTTTAIIAASVSAGVIAGIVLAIALCVGAGGAGSYAAYTKMQDVDAGPVSNNPLYTGTKGEWSNPLNKS
jgi:hypothetical protein